MTKLYPATDFMNKFGWTQRSLNRKLQNAPCGEVKYMCVKTGQLIHRLGRKPLNVVAYITQKLAESWDDLSPGGSLYAFVTKHDPNIVKIGKARVLKARMNAYTGFNKPHVILWTLAVPNRHCAETHLRRQLATWEGASKSDLGNEWFHMNTTPEEFVAKCNTIMKNHDDVSR